MRKIESIIATTNREVIDGPCVKISLIRELLPGDILCCAGSDADGPGLTYRDTGQEPEQSRNGSFVVLEKGLPLRSIVAKVIACRPARPLAGGNPPSSVPGGIHSVSRWVVCDYFRYD